MPRQQRLWRHQSREVTQGFPAKSFRPFRQPNALLVHKPNSPVPKWIAEDSILISQVFQGVLLALIRPAPQYSCEKAKGIDAVHFRLSYHPRPVDVNRILGRYALEQFPLHACQSVFIGCTAQFAQLQPILGDIATKKPAKNSA